MHQNFNEWNLGQWQIFLDSPMAIEVTKIYSQYADFSSFYKNGAPNDGKAPLELPNLSISESPQDSMALNNVRSGAIIIAGSGMCTGGRIRHHLKYNISRKGTHVIMVGYQARNTLGRILVDGAEQIKLWGEMHTVQAKIHTIGGLSAHADQEHLLQWYGNFKNRPPVVLIHGEETAMDTLAPLLRDRYHADVIIPSRKDTLDLVSLKPLAVR